MSDTFDALHFDLQGQPREHDPAYWNRMAERGSALIETARRSNDPEGANRAWHLTAVATVRATMGRLFAMMGEERFRTAWSELENVEKMIGAIERNAILKDEFAIRQLGAMVADWQELYPYTVFASPELIIRQQECTICDAVVSPIRPCGHLPGFVYSGEMCSRRIKDFEAVSIALVRDPVQKYSVLIPDPDPHDYARVRFVLDRLAGPFSRWRLQHTSMLHDHSCFKGWSPEGNCPCQSGYRYADCCRPKAGVILPHDRIVFEELPPAGLSHLLIRLRANPDGEMEDVAIKDQTA